MKSPTFWSMTGVISRELWRSCSVALIKNVKRMAEPDYMGLPVSLI